MNRSFWPLAIVSALLVTACSGRCEYDARIITARVTLSPPSSDEIYNCINDPVAVELTWDGGSDLFRTTNWENPPRACVEALGLVDGAEVRILLTENTGGGGTTWNGLVVCEPYTVTLMDIDPAACDAACNAAPVCPAYTPKEGDHCFADLLCHYGYPVACEPGPGTSMYHECSNGIWTVSEKENCVVCGVSCDPPCLYCADKAFFTPAEPGPFCTDTSETLYAALMTCTCTPGNPCEPVCNTGYCVGGAMTAECETCLTTVPQPDGCQTEFEACMNDF